MMEATMLSCCHVTSKLPTDQFKQQIKLEFVINSSLVLESVSDRRIALRLQVSKKVIVDLFPINRDHREVNDKKTKSCAENHFQLIDKST
jgi:hypothetical protein